MSGREVTHQQLDPSASLGTWPLTVLLTAGAFVYAVVATVVRVDEAASVALLFLSLGAFTAACGIVVIGSSARRAPFRRRTHLAVHVIVMLAIVLSIAAEWHTSPYVRNDWWPVAFGLLLFALGPYRPGRELAAAGSISATLLGFLVLLQSGQFVAPAPPVAFVLVAMTPVLALCYASVAYYGVLVRALEDWGKRRNRMGAAMIDQFREGIMRSVQQDRVTILSRDVLPFFSDVLGRDAIDSVDRERARAIAESIRRVMVDEADRSWLESLVDNVTGGADAIAGSVSDDARLAAAMTNDQRTSLRALLIALSEDAAFDRRSLHIQILAGGGLCHATLTADFAAPARAVKRLVAPYVAVMRMSFVKVRVERVGPVMGIRFSYELR